MRLSKRLLLVVGGLAVITIGGYLWATSAPAILVDEIGKNLCTGYLQRDTRTCPIMAASTTIYANKSVADTNRELDLIRATGFNAIRFYNFQDLAPGTIELLQNKTDLLPLIFVIFPQYVYEGQTKIWSYSIAELKAYVDSVCSRINDKVLYYEVFNELYSNANYTMVAELMDYVRSQTGKEVAISFHQDREDVFQTYVGLCDLVCRHWYTHGTNTSYSYADFQSRIEYLLSFNKPTIISEINMFHPVPSEKLQACFFANTLHMMKEFAETNPNFRGYSIHAIRDCHWDTYGIHHEDYTPKLCAPLFP